MRVCHPPIPEAVQGGVTVSAEQQLKALEYTDVECVEELDADCDVLHLNFIDHLSLYRIWKARRQGTKVVIHAHSVGENIAGTYRFSRFTAPLVRAYYSRVYNAADAVIAVSGFMEERLRNNGVETPVRVISNGVDTGTLDGYRDVEVDGKYDAEPPTVVNLAQVYRIKGVGDFLRTASELLDTDFRWFGPKHTYLMPAKLKREIEAGPDNVRFPGFVDDKREAFALGDVFFFPTHRDNQPLAVLEAMYCGMPIVTRDIPAFEGWLEHGHNCLKADSVAGFVDAIKRLEEDEELGERLGENARKDAEKHSLESVGAELEELYRDTVGGLS